MKTDTKGKSTPIGRAVRELRHLLRLSQRQLADAIGVTRGHVAQIEHGMYTPSLEMAEPYADAAGVTPEEIRDGFIGLHECAKCRGTGVVKGKPKRVRYLRAADRVSRNNSKPNRKNLANGGE